MRCDFRTAGTSFALKGVSGTRAHVKAPTRLPPLLAAVVPHEFRAQDLITILQHCCETFEHTLHL
jgi:hypothetical protein